MRAPVYCQKCGWKTHAEDPGMYPDCAVCGAQEFGASAGGLGFYGHPPTCQPSHADLSNGTIEYFRANTAPAGTFAALELGHCTHCKSTISHWLPCNGCGLRVDDPDDHVCARAATPDRELEVMRELVTRLRELDNAARLRLLRWATAFYEAKTG